MTDYRHIATQFPTEYVRAGNPRSLTCREVESSGDVAILEGAAEGITGRLDALDDERDNNAESEENRDG